MKSIFTLAILSALVLSPINQIHGQQEKEVRDVGYYHSLKVSGSHKIELTRGKPGKITLEGSDLSNFSTNVKNGTLHIQSKSGRSWANWSKGSITAVVPVESLKGLSLSGSGKIESSENLKSNKLKVSLSGSGKIDLNITSDAIEVALSGSGGLVFAGQTEKANFSLAGSGVIKASDLKAKSAVGNISGSGVVHLYASESFNGNVSGSGRIKCYGDPENRSQKVLGSGRISFVD